MCPVLNDSFKFLRNYLTNRVKVYDCEPINLQLPPNTRALFSYWLVDNNKKNLMKLRKVNGGDKRSVSVCETCCKFPRIHICGITVCTHDKSCLSVTISELVQRKPRLIVRVLHHNEKINCK